MSRQPHILIVEDNAADVFLVREAISTAEIRASVHVVNDGHQAIEAVNAADTGSSPAPDIIVLDLNLPKRTGDEVLRHIRASRMCREATVVVVTSSDALQDRQQAATLGADAYFQKPADFDQFMELGGVLRDLLARRATRS